MNKDRENILIGITVFLLYFVQSLFQDLPLKLIGIDYYQMSLNSKIIYLLCYEFVFILILFLIYRKRFTNDFKDYIKNFKTYTRKYIEYWALAFGLMILSNLVIVNVFPTSVATNQENVNAVMNVAPLYMFISAVIYAPIIEETIFRLSIRNIFKNDTLFIIISGLIFGGLHVFGSFEKLVDLIYIIPYSIPGFVFAYTLVKSKNIFVPMSLHFFHNGFTMIMQIILGMLV